MNIWKYFDITHSDHTFMNPTTSEKLDEMVSLLDLKPGARVLDIGCGKAEPLMRIAERYAIFGVGVDASPFCIEDARENALRRVKSPSEVSFVESDAAKYDVADASQDLVVCLGASWVFGGMQGTLATASRILHPGGLVLIGEPHWIKEPDPEYLRMSGMTPDLFSSHAGNVSMGTEVGLVPIYAVLSTKEDFDRYEWLQFRAGERWARNNPDDPDVAEVLKRVRHGKEEYTRFGRDTLGWGMYLYLKE